MALPRIWCYWRVGDELAQAVWLVQYGPPECMDGTIYVIDVNVADEIIEQECEGKAGTAGVGLGVMPICEVVALEDFLDEWCQLGLAAGITQRTGVPREVGDRLIAGHCSHPNPAEEQFQVVPCRPDVPW